MKEKEEEFENIETFEVEVTSCNSLRKHAGFDYTEQDSESSAKEVGMFSFASANPLELAQYPEEPQSKVSNEDEKLQ